MSKPGEALANAYKQNQQRQITETAKRKRAIAAYEQRETDRLRDQQAVLRAAMYARHPELRAA